MPTEPIVFQRLSDTTTIYEPPPDAATPTNEGPTTILICGWMGGTARNLSRYTTKYNTLYPAARIVLISSTPTDTPGFRILLSSKHRKQRADAPAKALILDAQAEGSRLLVHAFSNGGGMSLGAISKAYQQLSGTALPARLVVFDSVPGGDKFTKEFGRWVGAFAVGLPSNILIRWPALVLLGLVVAVQLGLPSLFGTANAATKARADLNDEKLINPQSKRLYLYSDADALIGANEVREHAAESASKGWSVETINFKTSGHIRHAIEDPERYWKAITELWNSSVQPKKAV
ncbi:hypothetical protein B0A52_02729 [Exophiala mesophila]|uniref:DUF829 domain-containing protein n=1 Tax=Exophiala mesophila TaxID=212818 RepID=A0A438NDW6_EXOME|nr:hypothetical protein B0A52_02729 [Exophiala mesophila]